MSKKCYFKMGSLVAFLVVAVTFLTAPVVNADVILGDPQGSYDLRFNTDDTDGYVVGNSYTVSETFTLKDPNWFFTSFTINPETVTLMVQSIINNASPSMPAVDLTGEFTGTARWSGQVTIRSGNNTLGYTNVENYSQEIDEITYPNSLTAGKIGMATSPEFGISFTELLGLELNLDADELGGAKEISFDFSLSDIFFENNEIRELGYAGVGNIWDGSIEGLVSMGYDTSVSSTPEPATLLIFGMGIAGAGIAAYRKRRGQK